MPRKPRIIETGDEGEAGQPATAASKPEGISDQEWAIGGILGNLALATALLDVTSGQRAPKDARETSALMDAARKLEARSYKRYRRLVDSVGQRIADAQYENAVHADMLAALREIDRNPNVIVGKNGPRPGEVTWQEVYGPQNRHGHETVESDAHYPPAIEYTAVSD